MRIPPLVSGRRAGIVAVMATAALGWVGVASSHENFYQGHATGASGTVTIGGVKKSVLLADNYMSCVGKPKDETVSRLTNRTPLGVILSNVHTFTQGIGDTSASEVHVASATLDLPDLKIEAGALEGWAQASCNRDTLVSTSSGGSRVAWLKINGEGIEITAEPNQTIEIPGVATVIINEQVKYKPEFRVNAIHVKLFNESDAVFGDVYAGFARAKVVCTP